MPEQNMRAATEGRVLFQDHFEQDQRPGTVVGSRVADGLERLGVDAERIMSIDHGALRIEPLYKAGWGRESLSYGPFRRQNGLALSVFMLNGHNTSQMEGFPTSMTRRMARWAFGSLGSGESKAILFRRLARWIRSRHTRSMVRRVRWWFRLKALSKDMKLVDENMAVGWFSRPVPGEHVPQGNGFVMHALGPENGELWAHVGSTPLPAVRGVQNVPIYYVVILRESGAAYYAASLPSVHGMTAYPSMRPLAIDPFQSDEDVYAGVHQCILGQVGFRAATRVYGVTAAVLPECTTWYGTAHAADALLGTADVTGSVAEVGGEWHRLSGGIRRTEQGAVAYEPDSAAVLRPEAPSGLIHAVLECEQTGAGAAGLIWRAASDQNYWLVSLGAQESRLCIVESGLRRTLAASPAPAVSGLQALQMLDDGQSIAVYLNGALLFDRLQDTRLADATGIGIWASGADRRIRHVEAHPRSVPIPPSLDQGAPWFRQGERIAVTEAFEGEARPLDGKTSTSGGATWQRTLGSGHVDVLGNGMARVRASAEAPNPGRTAFTVAWDCPDFADLLLDMTPPGTGRGNKDRGRGGVIFWQDADNYILVSIYLDDSFAGASVSSFFHLGGFEELYDAVWTNTTRHLNWGVRLALRVQFDGVRYLAFINDEAVLFRSLTDVYPGSDRLVINRVGLVANWEWGDDTGTILHRFEARSTPR